MAEHNSDIRTDPTEPAANFAKIAEQSQKIMAEFLNRNAEEVRATGRDPQGIGRAFMELTGQMLANPAKLAEAQAALWQDYMKVWHTAARRMMGETAPPVAPPPHGDPHIKHADCRRGTAPCRDRLSERRWTYGGASP